LFQKCLGNQSYPIESKRRQAFETLAKLMQAPWKLKKAVKRWTDKDGPSKAYLGGFKMPLEKVIYSNIGVEQQLFLS
jgi:hypothetical protein